jgi:phosphatidylserine decarboxylase
LFFVGLVLTLWCVYFFRNPERFTPVLSGANKNNLVISPADGRVIEVSKITPDEELGLPDGNWTRVCVFMNVFDVHVNRSPMSGQITYKNYIPGAFFNASMDKASSDNERLILGMDTENGKKIAFVQIAGLVARRIICDVDIGSHLKSGDIFGIIRFGSRVDIYFPSEASTKVLVGQKMIAGETIIADFTKSSKPVTRNTDEK